MHGIDPEAIARAKRYDPGLDVDALIASLTGRANWDGITNKTAYFVATAKRVQREGDFRRGGSGSIAAPVEQGDAYKLAEQIVVLFHDAAHGKLPDALADGLEGAMITLGSRVDLRQVVSMLRKHGVGWSVKDADDDIPF